ncbi:TATA box-binding protein-like 1 [Ptychodera flava]|uniref:TATA box-binding protein-like 1 n=1 Tax=Ptychodera flava TaxID=63121 RepID=UPI00396A1711
MASADVILGTENKGNSASVETVPDIVVPENVTQPNANEVDRDDNNDSVDVFINNVVCTFSTRCHLNLKRIGMEGVNVEYRRDSGKVMMRIRNPYCTATIWSSGKITCAGCTSEEDAKRAAKRIARSLQNLGFRVRFANFRVVNVLGTCSMPFGIRIGLFSKQHPHQASYEPELHPAVTYKIRSPKATLKIFSTGSITITAPSVENIQLAVQHIYPLVHEHKMPKPKVEARDYKDRD